MSEYLFDFNFLRNEKNVDFNGYGLQLFDTIPPQSTSQQVVSSFEQLSQSCTDQNAPNWTTTKKSTPGLAKRIAKVDELRKLLLESEEKRNKTLRQLTDLQNCAKSVTDLYTDERKKRIEFEEQAKTLHMRCEDVEIKLAAKTFDCEKLEVDLAKRNGQPIAYKDLLISYIKIANKCIANDLSTKHERQLAHELSKYCAEHKIKVPAIATAKKLHLKTNAAIQCDLLTQQAVCIERPTQPPTCTKSTQCERPDTRCQGSQYVSTTTTRSTSTSGLIEQRHVGTAYPEPQVDAILQEARAWCRPQPLSPIREIRPISPPPPSPPPPSPSSEHTTRTRGTITNLYNVQRKIDFSPLSSIIKKSDSRPSSRSMYENVKSEASILPPPYQALSAAPLPINNYSSFGIIEDLLQLMILQQKTSQLNIMCSAETSDCCPNKNETFKNHDTCVIEANSYEDYTDCNKFRSVATSPIRIIPCTANKDIQRIRLPPVAESKIIDNPTKSNSTQSIKETTGDNLETAVDFVTSLNVFKSLNNGLEKADKSKVLPCHTNETIKHGEQLNRKTSSTQMELFDSSSDNDTDMDTTTDIDSDIEGSMECDYSSSDTDTDCSTESQRLDSKAPVCDIIPKFTITWNSNANDDHYDGKFESTLSLLPLPTTEEANEPKEVQEKLPQNKSPGLNKAAINENSQSLDINMHKHDNHQSKNDQICLELPNDKIIVSNIEKQSKCDEVTAGSNSLQPLTTVADEMEHVRCKKSELEFDLDFSDSDSDIQSDEFNSDEEHIGNFPQSPNSSNSYERPNKCEGITEQAYKQSKNESYIDSNIHSEKNLKLYNYNKVTQSVTSTNDIKFKVYSEVTVANNSTTSTSSTEIDNKTKHNAEFEHSVNDTDNKLYSNIGKQLENKQDLNIVPTSSRTTNASRQQSTHELKLNEHEVKDNITNTTTNKIQSIFTPTLSNESSESSRQQSVDEMFTETSPNDNGTNKMSLLAQSNSNRGCEILPKCTGNEKKISSESNSTTNSVGVSTTECNKQSNADKLTVGVSETSSIKLHNNHVEMITDFNGSQVQRTTKNMAAEISKANNHFESLEDKSSEYYEKPINDSSFETSKMRRHSSPINDFSFKPLTMLRQCSPIANVYENLKMPNYDDGDDDDGIESDSSLIIDCDKANNDSINESANSSLNDSDDLMPAETVSVVNADNATKQSESESVKRRACKRKLNTALESPTTSKRLTRSQAKQQIELQRNAVIITSVQNFDTTGKTNWPIDAENAVVTLSNIKEKDMEPLIKPIGFYKEQKAIEINNDNCDKIKVSKALKIEDCIMKEAQPQPQPALQCVVSPTISLKITEPITVDCTPNLIVCDQPASPMRDDVDNYITPHVPRVIPLKRCAARKLSTKCESLLEQISLAAVGTGTKKTLKMLQKQRRETISKLQNVFKQFMLNDDDINIEFTNVIEELQSFSDNMEFIVDAIISYLLEVDALNEPSTARFLHALFHLETKYPQFICEIMSQIELNIFKLKNRLKSEKVLFLIQLYLKAISIEPSMVAGTIKNPARMLVAKFLYFYRSPEPFIYAILCVYPTVLPHRENTAYDRSDPLITIIQQQLMHIKYDMDDKESCGKELLSKLRYEYHFMPFKPDVQEVLANLIEKLKIGKVSDLPYAFALYCKRLAVAKIRDDVLARELLPIANEYYKLAIESTDYDERIEAWLAIISMSVKCLPLDTDIEVYMSTFTRFLNAVSRARIQEAAVQAILRMQRFGFEACEIALAHFKQPIYELSSITKAMLRTFVKRRKSKAVQQKK